jgi:hypothetical protein
MKTMLKTVVVIQLLIFSHTGFTQIKANKTPAKVLGDVPVTTIEGYKTTLVKRTQSPNGNWDREWNNIAYVTEFEWADLENIIKQTGQNHLAAIFQFDNKKLTIDFAGGEKTSTRGIISGKNDITKLKKLYTNNNKVKDKPGQPGNRKFPFRLRNVPLAIFIPFNELQNWWGVAKNPTKIKVYLGIEPANKKALIVGNKSIKSVGFETLTVSFVADGYDTGKQTWPIENFSFIDAETNSIALVWPAEATSGGKGKK